MEKLTEPTGIRTRDPSFSLHRPVTQAARPHCSANRSSSIALFLTMSCAITYFISTQQ